MGEELSQVTDSVSRCHILYLVLYVCYPIKLLQSTHEAVIIISGTCPQLHSWQRMILVLKSKRISQV